MECHDGNRGSHSRSLATSAGSGARVPCPLTRRELLRLPPNLRAWPSRCQVVTGAPPPLTTETRPALEHFYRSNWSTAALDLEKYFARMLLETTLGALMSLQKLGNRVLR